LTTRASDIRKRWASVLIPWARSFQAPRQIGALICNIAEQTIKPQPYLAFGSTENEHEPIFSVPIAAIITVPLEVASRRGSGTGYGEPP
jgi:hypothetical protein